MDRLPVVAGGQTTNHALSGQEAGIAPSATSDGHGGTELTFAPLDHWTSSRGGNWPTASDWSMGAPTSALVADIDAAGTYVVTIASAATAYELLVNHTTATVADAPRGALTLAGPGGSANPNGALTITAGAFDLAGGALIAGSIAIGSGARSSRRETPATPAPARSTRRSPTTDRSPWRTRSSRPSREI
jgi:hypothetical protein